MSIPTVHRFAFGTITVHRPGFLEAVMDDGVEIGAAEAAEITSTLGDAIRSPYVILIDRRHRYSLTHDALVAIAGSEHLVAMAIVVYDSVAAVVATFQKIYRIPLEVFRDRESALAWLQAERDRAQQLPRPTVEFATVTDPDQSPFTA